MRTTLTLALASLLLTACGGQPAREGGSAAEDQVPEITLNLPNNDCACQMQQQTFTFLEKGFNALEEGAYLESLQYFQRYQRIEKTDVGAVEAGIAIAYLSTLPESPIFDRETARDSYVALRPLLREDMELHAEVQLMRASLESFLDMYKQIDRLKQTNGSLRAELEKREDAIKRLRDLTLGREPEVAGPPGS